MAARSRRKREQKRPVLCLFSPLPVFSIVLPPTRLHAENSAEQRRCGVEKVAAHGSEIFYARSSQRVDSSVLVSRGKSQPPLHGQPHSPSRIARHGVYREEVNECATDVSINFRLIAPSFSYTLIPSLMSRHTRVLSHSHSRSPATAKFRGCRSRLSLCLKYRHNTTNFCARASYVSYAVYPIISLVDRRGLTPPPSGIPASMSVREVYKLERVSTP